MVIEISYAIELTKNLSDVHNNIFDISQNLIHYNVKKHHFNASLDLILSTKTQAWQLKLIFTMSGNFRRWWFFDYMFQRKWLILSLIVALSWCLSERHLSMSDIIRYWEHINLVGPIYMLTSYFQLACSHYLKVK